MVILRSRHGDNDECIKNASAASFSNAATESRIISHLFLKSSFDAKIELFFQQNMYPDGIRRKI